MATNSNINNAIAVDKEKIRRTSENTEYDAVHPRLNSELSARETEEYQKKYHYFCATCSVYFAPTTLALHEHFRPGRIVHERTSSCIYCQGPVYTYSINAQIRLYHDCMETIK